MRRLLSPALMVTVAGSLVAFAAVGCQTSADSRRPVQPLPVDGPVLTYREVVSRARLLATQATEAFYIDQWRDVENAALSLEETARYLPKSAEVPTSQRLVLEDHSRTLEQQSISLRDAARAHDEKKTTDAMQRVNLLVRDLRPE